MAAFLYAPTLVLSVLARLLVAAWLTTRDRWLGYLAVYVVIAGAVVGTDDAVGMTRWFLTGAVIVTLLRGRVPQWTGRALVASGALMVLLASLQWLGVDPVIAWPAEPVPVGTFANRRYLGAFLAVVTPLAPFWLLPWFAFGLVLSQSWLAAVSAALGLAVARGARASAWYAVIGGVLGALLATRGPSTATLSSRLEAWGGALGQMDSLRAWLVGHGPASWSGRVYQAQFTYWDEQFHYSHSEPLQWLYEMGLVGCALLGGWCWTNRAMLSGPWRASLAAAVPLVALFHPFHWAPLAPAMLLVVGAALPKDPA